jgi:predicted phage baseplate assembly protein
VPERLYVHFLNMVGIEPFPPSVARADLTFWLTAALSAPVIVPAGTQVTTAAAASGGSDAIAFSTVDELAISPPQLRSAKTVTAGDRVTDVWDDLRYDPLGVRCFASPELTPGDGFYLGFAESLAGVVLQLSFDAQAAGIGVDPLAPPIAWEVWNGEGWIPTAVYEDTTGGLNRVGTISLLVPIEHELLSVGNESAYWLRARLLAPLPGQPTYQASPRVHSVRAQALGGTVTAEHAETVDGETLGRSDGSPGQTFTVSRAPVLPRRTGQHVQVIDADGTTDWSEVDDFTLSGPLDRHFAWDSSTGTVRFGPRVRYPDGSIRQHGAIPRDGSTVRVTGYHHGGGAAGNVGARTLTVLRSGIPFIRGVINLKPASGGVDAETIAEAKVRGPMTLRTGQRAVTVGDYERLTLESSTEVARARCLPAGRGNGAVRVLIVPQIRGDSSRHRLDDFAISAPLMTRVSERLDAHRVVGTAVEIGTPYYQGVSVAALVHAAPGRPAPLVRQRAVEALNRYINPLTGGPEGTGWPFDADLNVASVAQLLESVDGVERVEEALLFEWDLRTGRRLGSAKDVVRLDADSLFLSAPHQVVIR